MKKVSIIIPAYNVEGYIFRSVKSAIEQSLKDIEIIIVNDGSTDNTIDRITELQSKYSQIVIIDKVNEGVSVARNIGVEKARGEYVCFLDADDYYADNNVLEKFYTISKENDLDVIRGAYKIYDENIKGYKPHNVPSFPKINQVIFGNEFLISSIKHHFNEVVPWLGLFKRDYLIKNNLSFPKGITYEEDQLIFLKAMLKNGRFMQTDTYFYTYVIRNTSCARNLTFKKAEDVAFIINEELKLIRDLNLKKRLKKATLIYISSSFYQITSIYGRIDKSKRKACVKLVPFKTRFKLMCNPYNSYHFKKIFLYNFARIVLNKYYDRGKNV